MIRIVRVAALQMFVRKSRNDPGNGYIVEY